MSIPATERIYLGSTYREDATGKAAGPFGLSATDDDGLVVAFSYRGDPTLYVMELENFCALFSPVQCAGCTGLQPFDRSCGCFDNGGE